MAIFREMLWAEATRLGIGKDLVNVPSAITVADGGIDAEVSNCPTVGGQGLIKHGITRYQIKTGSSFTPTASADLRKLLFNDSKEWHARVKACFDRGGTFILVLFGWDKPETRDDQIVEEMKRIILEVDPACTNPKIEIFRQGTVIGFLRDFPSISLAITARSDLFFQAHGSWAQDADMSVPFKSEAATHAWISNVQGALRGANAAIHIRVLGEAGIGKTRLAFEATKADDLRPLDLPPFFRPLGV